MQLKSKILLLTLSFCFAKTYPALAADPDADVAARQQLFRQMQTAFDQLQTDSKTDPLAHKAELGEAAQRMSDLAGQPWVLFGQATTITRRNNHAAPTIQSDPAGFRAAAAAFQTAALNLNATLLTKKDADAALLQKQVGELANSCASCHAAYLR